MHDLNMSGRSIEYLKYLPEREDKIGLVFLTSRECNFLLAAYRKMLARSEDLFYTLVSALHSKQFSINMAFSSLV